MKAEKRKNVLEFYSSIRSPGMTKASKLTNKAIEIIAKSDWFAKWMIANKYGESIESMKNTIHGMSGVQ